MDDVEALEKWARLVARQHGVVNHAQAIEHGFTDARILAQVMAGRWERCRRGVLSTTTGPLTHEAELFAALLSVGPVAALSHDTAAHEWGMLPLSRDRPERWHVTVPYGASASGHPEVDVHRSRAFAHIAVERDGLVLTSPAHTVIDLACAAPDAPAAMGVALRTATAGRVSAAVLREAVERRGIRRFQRALLDAIRLLEAGVTSVLEARYTLDVERAHGLPEPVRQVPVDVDGTTLFEDCVYRCPRGEAVVRLDGHASHERRRVRLRDRRRGNAAELAGKARLVYGWEEVAYASCQTAGEVAVVLRGLGRTGEFERCPRCP